MNQKKGNWYLLSGILLGIGIGLLYAWVISPVKYTVTSPSTLRSSDKDTYRMVIAEAYAADGDLGRAQSRLTLLGDADSVQALAQQAQQILQNGGLQTNASILVNLASALEMVQGSTTMNSGTATATESMQTLAITSSPLVPSETVTATILPSATPTAGITRVVFTATATITPSPTVNPSLTAENEPTGTQPDTPTPTATHGAPFALKSHSQVCDQTQANPMLSIQINDASGNPVAGIKIQISWQGGQNAIFTGLMPEINAGYANFMMTQGISYTVQLTDGGKPVSDLQAIQCTVSGGQSYWGGWYLVFQQP